MIIIKMNDANENKKQSNKLYGIFALFFSFRNANDFASCCFDTVAYVGKN